MRRNTLNFWLDLFSFLVMLGLIWTGLLVHFVLPPGTGARGGGHGLRLWGLGRHGYGDIHFYLAIVLMGLMIIHVWLHWSWVCATLNKLVGMKSKTSAQRVVSGITLLATLAILMIGGQFWARGQVESTDSTLEREMVKHEAATSVHISGQTTLVEAARIKGVQVEALISQLNLPANVDVDERLGRLRRRYDFEIDDVRRTPGQDN